jgi:hypothetical protein
MENNTKKGLIAAGIIALLVWFNKKGKVTETPTEEPSGGGGGGIGGGMPTGITMITTPVAIATKPVFTTTRDRNQLSNASPTLKDALGVKSADNVQANIPRINPITGLPYGSMGGAILQKGQTLPKTAYTPTSGGTALGGGTTNPKPFYKPTSGGTPIGTTGGINPTLPKTPYTPTSGGTALGGGVKSGGVSSSLKNALGSQSGLNVFVGFDGKIIRPSHKVDFF